MSTQVIEGSEKSYHPPVVISGLQIKLARTALGWTAQRLADEARLGIATVSRAERADVPPITVSNLYAIQRALEAAGIIFIDDGEQSLSGGPGIRLRRRGGGDEE